MLSFPNCKINLGLHITGRLPDGFHSIETVLFPVPLTDILEIIISKKDIYGFQITGIELPGDKKSNLVVKAYELLKTEYQLPAVQIHLHKKIPAGAGLGGGSSDGAFTIKMLDKIFNLDLSTLKMEQYAAKLGSDCPFFIRNKPAFATGTGNRLHEIEVNLKGYVLVIVKPDINIGTAYAYSLVTPVTGRTSPDVIIKKPVEEWKGLLTNDFEKPVFKTFPLTWEIKNKLYELGAVYASLSGSGSALFGLFSKDIDLSGLFDDCFVFKTVL